MYRNKKSGIIGIIVTVIILILIVIFSNGEKNSNFFENAATNLVPASENKSHGGYIGSLIRINKMKTGDKFNIILIEDKSDKKTPQYQPIPVCSPSTNKTPSFMEKMQQVTGLTGALLITYIIISEGSRVVFPPRNLVPIP